MMGSQYSDGHPPYPNDETVTGLGYHAVHRLACIPDVGSAMSYLIPSTYIYIYTLTQGLLPVRIHNYVHMVLDISLQ